MKTLKYTLKAIPERTVVRIPLTGKMNTYSALLKEIKKQEVPPTAKVRLATSKTTLGTTKEARFVWPTTLAA